MAVERTILFSSARVESCFVDTELMCAICGAAYPVGLRGSSGRKLVVASDLIRRVKESGLENPILIEPPRRQERQDEIAGRPRSSIRFRLMAPLMNAASDLCVLGVLGGSNLTLL